MDVSVSALGAIVALVVAIGLILRKVPPVYGMMVGALVGWRRSLMMGPLKAPSWRGRGGATEESASLERPEQG